MSTMRGAIPFRNDAPHTLIGFEKPSGLMKVVLYLFVPEGNSPGNRPNGVACAIGGQESPEIFRNFIFEIPVQSAGCKSGRCFEVPNHSFVIVPRVGDPASIEVDRCKFSVGCNKKIAHMVISVNEFQRAFGEQMAVLFDVHQKRIALGKIDARFGKSLPSFFQLA